MTQQEQLLRLLQVRQEQLKINQACEAGMQQALLQVLSDRIQQSRTQRQTFLNFLQKSLPWVETHQSIQTLDF